MRDDALVVRPPSKVQEMITQQEQADLIFAQARKDLSSDSFMRWLCRVYGYLQRHMTEEDLAYMKQTIGDLQG